MVDVEINQGHAQQAMHGEGVAYADGDVVEKAESHGGCPLRMMTGRAQAAKRRGCFARQHQVRGQHGSAGRAQRGLHGEWVHIGVRVYLVVTLDRRGGHEFADVKRGMRAGKLLRRGQRRVIGLHVVEQALDQQHVIDGAQPVGAFRMVGTHFVTCAIGVGDVSGQQNLSP